MVGWAGPTIQYHLSLFCKTLAFPHSFLPWPKVGQNKQWGFSRGRNLKCKQQFSYDAAFCEASQEISKHTQAGIIGPLKFALCYVAVMCSVRILSN